MTRLPRPKAIFTHRILRPQARLEQRTRRPSKSSINNNCRVDRARITSTLKLPWSLCRRVRIRTRIEKPVQRPLLALTNRTRKRDWGASTTTSKRRVRISSWMHLASKWTTQAQTSRNRSSKDWIIWEVRVEPSMVHSGQTKTACTRAPSATSRRQASSRWLGRRKTNRCSLQREACHPTFRGSRPQMSISKTRQAKTNNWSLTHPLAPLPRCTPTSQARYHLRIYPSPICKATPATHRPQIRSMPWAACSSNSLAPLSRKTWQKSSNSS